MEGERKEIGGAEIRGGGRGGVGEEGRESGRGISRLSLDEFRYSLVSRYGRNCIGRIASIIAHMPGGVISRLTTIIRWSCHRCARRVDYFL